MVAQNKKAPRKTTKRGPGRPRKTVKKAKHFSYTGNVVGVVAMLVSIFAVLKLGLVGKMMANVIRFAVGNPYQIILIALMIPLIGVIVYGRWPSKFKIRYYVGFALLMVGIMLMMSIMLFSGLQQHSDFVGTLIALIQQDFANQTASTDLGGGLIGTILYTGTYFLLSNVGSWIIAFVLMLGGLIVGLNLNLKDIFATFFNLTATTGLTVENGIQTGLEKVKDKSTALRVRAEERANERKHFDSLMGADPFSDETPIEHISIDEIEPTVAVAPDANKSAADLTADVYKAPEIVAPDPVEPSIQVAAAPDAGLAAPKPYEAAQTFDKPTPTPQPSGAPIDDGLDSVDPASFVAASQRPATPQHANLTTSTMVKSSTKLRGNNDPNAVTSHQVGHVEPDMTATPQTDAGVKVIDDSDYILPSTSLLTRIGSTDQSGERAALAEKARILHDTLKSFHIDAEVEKVVLGPTITQYEIKPAVGVKVSRITNLQDDLALALAAKSLRIEAPIPGKSLVGIEVANEQQAVVGFRDMVDAVGVNRDSPLVVPIGKSVSGDIVTMDIRKNPHLLIAGATGSGKSVAINSILASILLQAKPSEVRLMLVDPKKVELSVYNDIPHLITPVVSDPRKAALALKKVTAEMDRRFQLLADAGARNIESYNKQVDAANQQKGKVYQRLPYLVVVIDELADLMMMVASEVEAAVIRIGQLGRAAGIHMILATQRPSVDVITGLIKTNVPSRMAFAVASGVDSRTILDTNGAEKLLGRGDMLFAPVGSNSQQRVQGAFLPDDDVEALTDFIKRQGEAQYDESLTVSDEEVRAMSDDGSDGGNHADEQDELWDEAVAFVVDQQKASTSLVQRRFRIGYNRAARLVDDMEAQQIIGPQDGAKPRRVLVSREALQQRLHGQVQHKIPGQEDDE